MQCLWMVPLGGVSCLLGLDGGHVQTGTCLGEDVPERVFHRSRWSVPSLVFPVWLHVHVCLGMEASDLDLLLLLE